MIEDEKAIRNLVEEWMKATKTGDVQTVLGLMTEDVLFTTVDQEPFGKVVFEETQREMSAKEVHIDAHNDIKELVVIGDWAYLRGHIQMKMTFPNSEPMKRSGYTLTILRKESDGQWRICRDANLVTKEQ